jgi:hypothetical protein
MFRVYRATESPAPKVGGFVDIGSLAVDQYGTEAGMMHFSSLVRVLGSRWTRFIDCEVILQAMRLEGNNYRYTALPGLSAVMLSMQKSSLMNVFLAGALLAGSMRLAAEPSLQTWDLSAGMDTAILPGDDFLAYANGSWLRDTSIPPDRSSFGTFAQLRERAADAP